MEGDKKSLQIAEQYNSDVQNTLIGALGIRYTYISEEKIEAMMPVDERTIQPFGILHGGAALALAETIAGVGSLFICDSDQIAVGAQVSANHFSSARREDVSVKGVGTIIHKGRSTHIWNIDIVTLSGRLISSVRIINSILTKKYDR